MNPRLMSLLGILVGLSFVGGFTTLFLLNPQTYDELNHISLASYNLPGMYSQVWAAVMYIMTGLLSTIFCIGLLSDKSEGAASLIGKILLLMCGLIWLSFGLLPYDPTTEMGNHILVIRLISLIIASFTGFILLVAEYDRVSKDKFLKWYTLSSAGAVILLSFLSAFIYYDETWIRTPTMAQASACALPLGRISSLYLKLKGFSFSHEQKVYMRRPLALLVTIILCRIICIAQETLHILQAS